jgi:hypothetical protein
VLRFLSAINERDYGPAFRDINRLVDCMSKGRVSQLRMIPRPELDPFRSIVVEALTQLRIGNNRFLPQIELQFNLTDPTRPEPIDPDAEAVGSRRLLVGSLEENLLAHRAVASPSRDRNPTRTWELSQMGLVPD